MSVDPLNHIAKQLLLQKGLQASTFIDQLVEEGVVSTKEAVDLKGVALQESIRGWRDVLRFVREKDPSRGLDALQNLLGKEDILSRDVLDRLQQLWISGTKMAAIFMNPGSFQVLHPQHPTNKLELPKTHTVNVAQMRKVLEMLGFKIVDVELVVETKTDELTQQFEELGRSLCDDSIVFVCISGLLTTFQEQGMLLCSGAWLHLEPAYFKPVGIPTVSIAHCLSRLPCSSVTCFIDCLPFHLRMEQIQTWKPLFQAFASYRNRQQSVCGYAVSYNCSMNDYLQSLYGTRKDPHHRTIIEGSYSQAMGVFASVIMDWSSRGRPKLSNRQIYDSLVYQLAEWWQSSRLGFPCPFQMTIQGDKARQFLGPSVIPYHQWHKSKKIEVLDDRIVVLVAAGRALKFARGEAALAHHPLAPEKTVEGKVTEAMGQFNSKVVITAEQPFFGDVKDLIIQSQKRTAGAGFLCVVGKGKPYFKVVIEKAADESRPEDVRKLVDYAKNQSLSLECSVQDGKELCTSSPEAGIPDASFSISVTETGEFVVKDLRGYLMSVYETEGEHLKRVLEEMAHFHLGMGLSHTLPPEYKYKCILMQDQVLLKKESMLPGSDIKVSASSEKGEGNRAQDGIIVSLEGVWKPTTSTDTEYLQFEFPKNHSVSAIEIRGDTESEEFVTKFNLSCVSQVRGAEEILLKAEPGQSSMEIHTRSEDAMGHSLLYTLARYVEIRPRRWFCPTARLMVTAIVHGDAPIKGIHVIGAYNMVVEPESARRRADVLEGGSVILMAAPDQPEHKITLDFEKVVRLKTIKLQALFDTPDEPESTIEATLVFIGAWSTVPHEGNTSIWSKRVTLEEPATGYRFRFTPLTYKNAVAMQVQLHGCPVCNIAQPLHVVEDSHLQIYLSVEKNKETAMEEAGRRNVAVYFYMLLFEYTGAVSLLSWDYVQPGTNKVKHIRTYFSKDLPAGIDEILDTYRVVSCTKELNLHGLLQKGPLEYTQSQSYNFVLPESGANIKDSEWDVVDLPVWIHRKRGMGRHKH